MPVPGGWEEEFPVLPEILALQVSLKSLTSKITMEIDP